jgi:hypothetical protein
MTSLDNISSRELCILDFFFGYMVFGTRKANGLAFEGSGYEIDDFGKARCLQRPRIVVFIFWIICY